jgi:hypothetical protein
MPISYVVDGVENCWLHHAPLVDTYPVSDCHFFTTYAWRGHESKFPLAKLYEASPGEQTSGSMAFCPDCQKEYERWTAEAGWNDVAEPEATDNGG